jgi:hypothetical protein
MIDRRLTSLRPVGASTTDKHRRCRRAHTTLGVVARTSDVWFGDESNGALSASATRVRRCAAASQERLGRVAARRRRAARSSALQNSRDCTRSSRICQSMLLRGVVCLVEFLKHSISLACQTLKESIYDDPDVALTADAFEMVLFLFNSTLQFIDVNKEKDFITAKILLHAATMIHRAAVDARDEFVHEFVHQYEIWAHLAFWEDLFFDELIQKHKSRIAIQKSIAKSQSMRSRHGKDDENDDEDSSDDDDDDDDDDANTFADAKAYELDADVTALLLQLSVNRMFHWNRPMPFIQDFVSSIVLQTKLDKTRSQTIKDEVAALFLQRS